MKRFSTQELQTLKTIRFLAYPVLVHLADVTVLQTY